MKTGPSVVARFFVEQPMLVGLLFVSLALHVALGFVFRVGTFERAVRGPSQPFVQYIGVAEEAALGLAAVRDPSMAALASPHGFSASTLAPPPHFPYQPPSADQPARPLLSPPPITEPANPFAAARPTETLITKLAPSSQEPAETPVAPTVARVVFSPSLASRAPRLAVESFRVEGPAPQQATVLSVAVDGRGVVRFALLAESSGSAAADNRGVQQVQAWRFEGAQRPANALDWGEVRIHWAGGSETATPAPAKGGVTR
ncbi:MAG: hypothetical protein HZC54_17645 [Verrucomicrobia bacterium]|nr:hypothetical protein [Verrucomicrobiota bacterium]